MNKQKQVLEGEGTSWAKIQMEAQHAVVHIFAYISRFNWLEPYQTGDQQENRGTGFFINSDGDCITTAHIVHEARQLWIQVPIMGQQLLPVRIISVCPDRDIALLRPLDDALQTIRALFGQVPYLKLGDSDTVMFTENVLVLGYPLEQYRLKSVTGIVSGREWVQGHSLIQITAPINPGNSGGPLINMQGQVIGITIATSAQAHNIGYAIPINELSIILNNLYSTPLVRYPCLGVSFSYATDELAQFLGNPLPAGLYICTVFRNSLFEHLGIRSGDMLYEFNGFRLDSYGDASVNWTTDKVSLHDLLARIEINEQVPLTICRHGEYKKLMPTLSVEYQNPIRFWYPDIESVSYEIFGGLVIMELTDNHLQILSHDVPTLQYYNQPENKYDPVLLITQILPSSYAYRMRILEQGALIEKVNGKPVKTIVELQQALRLSIDTDIIVIETKNSAIAVFRLSLLLAEEEQLSRYFMYPISLTLQDVQHHLMQRKENKHGKREKKN